MSASNTKELAQCLAFAYFAENPNFNSPGHDIGFYELFDRKQTITNYKTKYLSKTFPIDKLKAEFVVTRSINTQTKKEQVSYHITAKKVYKVAKECVIKGLFGDRTLDQFYYLDQSDPFVLLVKDQTLANIKTALKLNYKIDALSSVDIMIVSKTAKKSIEQEFTNAFKDKDITFNSIFINKVDYGDMINKYVLSGDLYPVSLKLPTILAITPKIKLVSFKRKPLNKQLDIDPYAKLLSLILQNPNKTNQIISQCIEIDFDNFSTGDVLNWVFPVNFNYNKVIDPITKKALEDYHLRFNLFAQGKGAGWNGQFDKTTRKYKDIQWVGGVGVGTFETFAKKYSEYANVVSKVTKIRLDVFEKLIKPYKDINDLDKQKVIYVLRQQKVIYDKKDLDVINEFLSGLDTKISLYKQFKLNVIHTITKENKNYSSKERESYIDHHFVHAQISYFILMGGYRFRLYFKQRMFLTIFGLITKQSHKVFNKYDFISMKNIIDRQIKINDDTIVAQFSAAPHYIIS